MAIGTVKFFNSTKGFGFIQPEDGTADVFVHISAVERAGISNLGEGQKLSFDAIRAAARLRPRTCARSERSRFEEKGRLRPPFFVPEFGSAAAGTACPWRRIAIFGGLCPVRDLFDGLPCGQGRPHEMDGYERF